MPKSIDNKKDILLLLLYSPGRTDLPNDPIIGRTRLVKMLFLFSKECLGQFKKGTKIDESNFYDFFPWNFGPFSKQIYDDITFFMLRGFILGGNSEEELLPEAAAEWQEWMRISSPGSDENGVSEYDEQSFSLSEKGLTFTRELYEALNIEQKNLLRTFKIKMNISPLKAILKYVYETYPDFTTLSHIREQVLGKR